MSSGSSGPTPGFLVWRLSTKWRVAVDRALAPLGLTHAHYVLLSSLHDIEHSGSRPNQRDLADRTGLEALYVSKLARRLEAAGLVARARDDSDSRAMRLSLTGDGEDVTRRAMQDVRRLVDQLLEPLGGLDGRGTGQFVHDLTALLEAPLETSRSPRRTERR
jgi:DNA-binding MarR family transcriptional regulator